MARLLLVLATAAALLATTAGASGNAFPQRIELPDGFQPEGIAIAGTQFYVGSIPTGAVYRGAPAQATCSCRRRAVAPRSG